jgi:hypothetical protein
MVEEKLALAMPKQAETAPPPAGAGCKAAIVGGSANSSEPAAAAAEEAAKQVAATATAAAAAEAASNPAHEQKQKDEAAKRKHEEEVADMVAVRNEVRIAMDDVLTIFDNARRSGCLAPQQVKEAYWVAFVIPVQSYVRGRPSKATPCFQTKHLLELQWGSAQDVVLAWPKVAVHSVSALFRAFKEGLPKYQVAAQALW